MTLYQLEGSVLFTYCLLYRQLLISLFLSYYWVSMVYNSGGGSTEASTGSFQSANQNEQLNNITGILQIAMLQDTLSHQLLPLTRSQANISSSIYNITRNTDTKVDLLNSDSTIQTTYILNLTDSIYQLLHLTVA